MKKKPTSQSAFFNLRVLVGVLIAMAGVVVALVGFGTFSARATPAANNAPASPMKYKMTTKSSIDPLVPAAFDCSKVKQFGIDRQENLRAGAIMIHCGLAKGGGAPPNFGPASARLLQNLMAPLVFGATDVDLITGTESFPNVTQSETFTTANPDDPSQVLVAYNDSRVATLPRSTFLARRSPPMGAQPLPVLRRPMAKAPSIIPLVIQWFYMTSQRVFG